MHTTPATSELTALVFEGAKTKGLDLTEEVINRINIEVSGIEKLDAVDYFLTYKDIVDICNHHHIFRSPGRGSACGSLVNYCLDITRINPLNEGLIFQRFLNTSISKFPDIDIDIASGKRQIIIDELKKKRPNEHINLVAFEPKEGEKTNIELNGLHYKEHACALIISKNPYSLPQASISENDYYLIHNYPDGLRSLDKRKFDILQLESLNKLEQIANELEPQFQPYFLDLNDKETLEFFSKKDLDGIFQCTSASNKLFSDLKPQRFQDIVIMNALYRPVAMEQIPKVIKNKNKGYNEHYPTDPRVGALLKETYGVFIYQETFMHITVQIAGFTYETADIYRIKLVRKNTYLDIVSSFEREFKEGCKVHSKLSNVEIEHLSQTLVYGIQYAFNKSHSMSYAMISFWGAYYKTHFRPIFNKVFGL